MFAAALLIGACDFGIDTKGLSGGDAAVSDSAVPDAPSDVASTPDVATETGPTITTLLGDTSTEALLTTLLSGTPTAYQFTATASGNAANVWIYADGQTNGPTSLAVGIYDDDSTTTPSQPKSLLAQATFASLSGGAWNSASLAGATISSGSKYWIVVLVTNGTLYYRNAGGTSGSLHSSSSSSSTLPTSWSVTTTAMDGPASMYVTN